MHLSTPAWSDLHDLALVYVMSLYSRVETRGLAEASLMETILSGENPPPEGIPHPDIVRRLGQFHPEVSERRLHQVFQEAFLMYVSVAGASMLDVAVVSLHRSLPRPRRLAVLNDLAGLASSSDELYSAGAAFVQYLAARWDLEPNPGRGE